MLALGKGEIRETKEGGKGSEVKGVDRAEQALAHWETIKKKKPWFNYLKYP